MPGVSSRFAVAPGDLPFDRHGGSTEREVVLRQHPQKLPPSLLQQRLDITVLHPQQLLVAQFLDQLLELRR